MAAHTVVYWRNFLRKVCIDAFSVILLKSAGNNLTLETNEYNVGRVPSSMGSGEICREAKEHFMYAVPYTTRDTLLTL